MKKLLIGFIFGLLSFAVWINPSFAQSDESQSVQTMLVATVNIYDATNTKINNNTYDISFRLKNKNGIQSDIRYGVQLVRKSDGKIVDMNLANEAITLGEGESKIINTTYTVPSFVPAGEYRILIVSQTGGGIPLASSPIGFPEKFITISSDTGVNIESCYLTVPTDTTSTQYTAAQGIDILPSEELSVTCEVTNKNVSGGRDLRLQLITHDRNQYGNILDNKLVEQNFSIGGNETQTITFKVPTLTKPQAYDVDAFFINNQGEKVSASTYFRYVISGNSATIQNTFLDKASYLEGETATVEVFWTPSADVMAFSRLGSTLDGYKLNARIINTSKDVCGESSKSLTSSYGLNSASINVELENDCENAAAIIEILDNDGNVLTSQEINLSNPVTDININPKVSQSSSRDIGVNKFYVVLFVLVLVLIGYGILVFRKDHKK